MRWLVVAVLASGCGRFAFDEFAPVEVCEAGLRDDGATVVCTSDDLRVLSMSPELWSGTFVLGRDIDLAGVTIEPIGGETQPFTGVFDGAGHALENLVIDRPGEDNIGLFGRIEGAATIRNLSILDARIRGRNSVGTLVGSANGTLIVEDLTVTSIVRGDLNVGGVAGFTECYASQGCTGFVFQRITADVDVEAFGMTFQMGRSAGGITGGTYSDPPMTPHGAFTDITVSGAIKGYRYVGGIVGDAELCRLTRTMSSATITADQDAGGLFGNSVFIATEILDSHASGHVNCRSMCGGAVGFLQGSAYRTSSSARVQCTGDSCGGLVGYLEGDCHECSATGDVSGTTQIGGLMGHAWSVTARNVRDSFATGTVTGTSEVGGFIGSLGNTPVSRSYSASTVMGTDSVGGLFGAIAGTNHSMTDSFFYGSITGSTVTNTVGWLFGSASVAVNQTNSHAGGGCSNQVGCTGAPTLGSAQTLYTPLTAPLNTWDFTTIWQSHPDTFPTLRSVTSP